ncbi:MAG: aldolase [Bdellovibrionaceae bacterium]|nr:aldolase [Pseudobdellovibrionaceae bacterium]
MVENREILQQDIVLGCQRLYGRNLLAAADGNVSYRISDDEILITPSGVAKAFMKPEQMAVMTLDGKVLEGKPSSESAMHLEVFRQCDLAKAVVHAHPPTLIGLSLARPQLKYLPCDSMSEVILAMGDVPFVPFARPSTTAMGEVLRPFLPQHRAMALSRHGALCWGESLDEAIGGMERLEHVAQILTVAERFGGATDLPPEDVEFLRQKRKEIGDRLL